MKDNLGKRWIFAVLVATLTLMPMAVGAQTVNASIGTLPAGGRVTIQFDVAAADPLPVTATSLSLQGTVSGDNFSDVLTDDPDTGAVDDPTVTQTSLPPVAICQDITVSADAGCQGTAAAADFDDGSYDPDGGGVIFGVVPAGPYPPGETSVILTVTDDEGDTDSCTAIITVEDNTSPTAVCQNYTAQLDAFGQVTIVPGDVDGGSTDILPVPTLEPTVWFSL